MGNTHEEHGQRLRRLRTEGEDWFDRRDEEIRAASKDGMSYRDIGMHIGLSQTGVQKIVKETRARDGGGQ